MDKQDDFGLGMVRLFSGVRIAGGISSWRISCPAPRHSYAVT
jgi:hypothetical protein